MHSFMGCVNTQGLVRLRSTSENYLKGLEFPASYFKVHITREEGEKLGLEITQRSDYLEVAMVHAAGVIVRWNANSTARAVQTLDRIILVNGVEGNSTLMMEELRSAASLNLRVIRVSEEDRIVEKRNAHQRSIRKVMKLPGPLGLGPGIAEPEGSKVIVLHVNNAEQFTALQPCYLLMVYANWCGHCKHVAPDYTRAANDLAEIDLPVDVKLAKFDDGDAANQGYASDKLNVKSYPAFYWFEHGKHRQIGGTDDAASIVAHVTALAKGEDPEDHVKQALLKSRPLLYRPDVDPSKVLDLEIETFDDIVLNHYAGNNRIWIVEYYSDKCPICRSIKPQIVEASEKVKKSLGAKVKFGAVNMRVFADLADRFGVTSMPWITSYYAGRKMEDMLGLGGMQTVVDFAEKVYRSTWKKEPVWAAELPRWPAKKDERKAKVKEPAAQHLLPGDNTTGTWRELLGRRTWFFLHTVAAKYPEAPTLADKSGVKHLVASLGQHYPCPLCRKHLQAKLVDPELGPVPTAAREELAVWFCKLHNLVNKDLQKPMHGCGLFELDLQYLKSCGECSIAQTVEAEEEAQLKSDEAPVATFDYFEYLGRRMKLTEGEL